MSSWSSTARLVGPLFGLFLLLSPPLLGQEPEPVVHAVLFYSPTCPHCHEVITTFLVPLQEEYGEELVILGMDTSQPWANELFWEALRHYRVPEDRWAVPFLIVGDIMLVGGFEIPGRFRAILEEGLAVGGIDLPDLPALTEFMEAQGLLDNRYPDRRIARPEPSQLREEPEPAEGAPEEGTASQEGQEESEPSGWPPEEPPTTQEARAEGPPSTDTLEEASALEGQDLPQHPPPPGPEGDTGYAPTLGESTAPTPDSAPSVVPGGAFPGRPLDMAEAARELQSLTMWDRFTQDPIGNSLGVLVLLGMAVSLFLRGIPSRRALTPWPSWIFPLLVLAGATVAAYLSFVEITHTEAVCGPVGDCNTVNQSLYATLFGFLPVGVLGLMGYALILALWALGQWGQAGIRDRAHVALWGTAFLGTFFSLYLTFLEPFVIGATCAWCLASAVIMTLLLWASAPLAARGRKGRGE